MRGVVRHSTRSGWAGALLVLLGPGVLAAAGLEAQHHLPGDTLRVASSPLEAAALGFVDAFAGASGERMSVLLSGGGIRLQLDATGHTGLSSRQAVAALREFVRGYEGTEVHVTRAAPVEGTSDRGFAEVLWSARMSGTSQEVRRTFFLGLTRGSGEWRVDEIRVLR